MSARTRPRWGGWDQGPLWWATAGLAALLTLTGAVANVAAAGSVAGMAAGVLVAVTVPGLLLIVAVAARAVLQRFGSGIVFGDAEGVALPVVGGVGFMALVGAALVFIAQPVREFAVLGGIAEPWAWVFPFVVEAGFVAFAVAFVVAGVPVRSARGAEVSS